METALNIAMILLSVLLMAVILMQAKGSGFTGGGGSSIYRTRRGIERTLFQFAIGVAVTFVLISIVSNILL